MATYTIVAVARTPQELTGPVLTELGPVAGSVAYTETLNEAPEASVVVDVDSLQDDIKARLKDLVAYPTELWVYRDSTIVAAGPLVGGDIKDTQLSADIRGLEAYTAFMQITTDKSWVTIDLATIAADAIDDWQDLAYGDYGIETAAVGTTGATRSLEIPGAAEPMSVYEFLLEQSEGGFDWWVDPDTRGLRVESARGSDLSDTVFLERGVTSANIRFSVSPGIVASEVFGVGTGPELEAPLTTTKSDTGVRASFGRAGTVFAIDPVENATHLGEATQAYLDDRISPYFIPGPGLIPVAGAGVDDFGVGDLVTYTFDAGLGQQTGTYRVIKRTVTVRDDGQETMSLEFAT